MKYTRLIPAAALLLAGCAGTPPRDPILEHLDRTLSAEKAPDEAIPASVRDHYARLLHEKAMELVRNGRPGEALRLLSEALERLPDESRLRKDLEQLEARKRAELSRTALERDMAEATWLAARLRYDRLQHRWEEETPLERLGDRLLQHRLDTLLEKLRRNAEQAIREKDQTRAQRLIALLESLQGKESVETLRHSYREAWPESRPAAKSATRARRKSQKTRPATRTAKKEAVSSKGKQDKALREALSQALQVGDLQKSRQLARRLARQHPDDPALEDLLGAIEAAIKARIDHLDELASLAYRDQNYQAAAALWQQILAIDPDNAEAKVRLERVQKVIANLQALQEKAPVESETDTRPPAGETKSRETPTPEPGSARPVQ